MNAAIPDREQLLSSLLDASPDERMALLLALDDPNDVLLALGDEAEHLTVVEVTRAQKASELVVALAEAIGNKLTLARSIRAQARALAYSGNFHDALASWQNAVSIANQANHPVEAAKSRLASMQALGELGRFQDAITEGEAALKAFNENGQGDLAARADANLGIVYHRCDDPSNALFHFDRARDALIREPVAVGKLDSNRGEALVALNDFAGAEKAFLSAIAELEKADVALASAIVEGNLADLAARRGNLQQALYYFERARRHLESDSASGHLARLLAEQADAMAMLGLYEDALTGYSDALEELDKRGLALEAARARAGMGTAFLHLGKYSQAETALAASATAFAELGNVSARARVDVMRGELAASLGRNEDAYKLTNNALKDLENRPAESAIARYQLAQLAMSRGDLSAASDILKQTMPSARLLDIAPLLADLLHLRGLVYKSQDKINKAIEDFEKSIEQIERVRGSLQAEQFRAAYLTNRLSVYHDLVVTLLDQSAEESTKRAFLGAEQAKSRSLLDTVRGAIESNEAYDDIKIDSGESQIISESAQLRGEINALYSQLGGTGSLGQSQTITEDWRKSLHKRELELQRLENRLASTQGVSGLYAPPVNLDTTQSLLPDNAAILEYFIANGEVLVFVVTRNSLNVYRKLTTTKELTSQVRRFQFQVNRALRRGAIHGKRSQRLLADTLRELRAIHASIIAPIQSELDQVNQLIVVPHGPMHLIPFGALWDGQEYFIDKHELLTVPSSSLLDHVARLSNESAQSDSTVVVGVADEAAPLIALEAESVASALGCSSPLLGNNATAAHVKVACANARIIHFACHGHFSASSPLGSGLKLADRWLTVRDIYSMRLQAELVTLSGCETGRNLVTAGDELMGLLRGFLVAGARSLLVSLWRVNDKSTANLMEEFYSLCHTTKSSIMPFAGALKEAQIRLRKQYAHPAFWAPFVLVGKP